MLKVEFLLLSVSGKSVRTACLKARDVSRELASFSHICETPLLFFFFLQNPLLHWKHAVLMFNNFGWLHSPPTHVPLCEQSRQTEVSGSVWCLRWHLSQSDHWTCCVKRSKNCTLFIFLIADIHFFVLITRKKQETIEALTLLMQRWPLFDTLDNKKYSFSFLICYLTVWKCVCVSVCVYEGRWGGERRI